MEWFDLNKEEVKHYTETLNSEELKNIITQGIQTEFWKLLRARLSVTLRSADANLKRRKLTSSDDLMQLAIWQTIFKQSEEVFNYPDNTLAALNNIAQTPKTGVKPTRGM